MKKIVTITFSPCIDKSISVPRLMTEQKLKCAVTKLEPGGGGINVARAIKKLGGDVTAIYPSGGYTGKYFEKLMNDEHVPGIVISTSNETRENIILFEEAFQNQYRFGLPGTPLLQTEWQEILDQLKKIENIAYIVVSGNIPPGVPADIIARIAGIAKEKQAKMVVDTSGDALKEAVEAGVYLIKPNESELDDLMEKQHFLVADIIASGQQLIREKKCVIVVVSMGMMGAMLITKDEVLNIEAPVVHNLGTVGAGDSMVAGIVIALSDGKSPREAALFGVACGTAATMNPGTELCHADDVPGLYKNLCDQYQEKLTRDQPMCSTPMR